MSLPGQPAANAMLLSAQVVNAYASALPAGRARRASWDFEEESPLRDARGFDLGGSGTVAQEFIDAEEDTGMANVILPNGARLYVDHAHPEYSSPEVTNPLDAVRWDKAGELVMLEAVRRVATMPGVNAPINLYKNNTDNKGASYGAHENYLCAARPRSRPSSVTSSRSSSPGRSSAARDASASGRTAAPPASRSASAPTSSRSRSGSRRR